MKLCFLETVYAGEAASLGFQHGATEVQNFKLTLRRQLRTHSKSLKPAANNPQSGSQNTNSIPLNSKAQTRVQAGENPKAADEPDREEGSPRVELSHQIFDLVKELRFKV